MSKRSIETRSGFLGKSFALRKVVECTLLAILLISSASATVLTVSPYGSVDSSVYTHIQDAINASSNGDTINVGTGTYIEQLDINKSITIVGIGANQNSVVVQSPAILATKFVTSGPNNNKPVIFVNNTTGVIIQKLTVNGSGLGNANYRMDGIAFYNAGGTVDHVTITGIQETPFNGNQHGVALYANNVDGNPRTLNATNNSIDNFQKNGMALSGSGLAVAVTDNTVTGIGPTAITAQNGIQVSYGAKGTIGPNNVVSGISYTGPSWAASSILVYIGDVNVTNNVVNNGQVGLYYIEGNGTVNGNTITGTQAGTGRGDYYGMVVDDPLQAKPNPLKETTQGGSIASPGTMAVDVIGNTITGGADNISSVGLEADAGYYGTRNITFNASGNTITGWGYGVEIYQCQTGCTGSVFDSVKANHNNISSNTINMDANSRSDATENWWGTAVRSDIFSNITGMVIFDPYYIDAAMTTLNVDVWSTWTNIGGLTATTPDIAEFNGKLYATVRGFSTGTVWIRSMDTSGTWTSWSAVPSSGFPGALAGAGPSIYAFNSKLYLVAVGTDNAIYVNSMNTAEIWSTWTNIGGLTATTPDIAEFNGKLYATVRGFSTATIWIRSMDTSGTWTSWSAVPSSGFPGDLAGAGPSIYAFNSKLYLMAAGTDNAIYVNSMNTAGTWSTWTNIGGLTAATPDIAEFSANGKLYATVRGFSTATIWIRSMDTSGTWTSWSAVPSSGFPGALAGAGPSIYAFNSKLYLMAAGTDNAIYVNNLS